MKMAEEQNLPNEEDVKKPEAALEAKASDVEIEIEDDTPEEDQNRKNLPKELVQKLESDELDDYDDKVKDKIYQLKKVWHDERREKERIARENAEAIRAAQKLREENKQLKANSENNQTEYLKAIESAADYELLAAKQAYKTAHDDGDTDKMTEAQQKISEATYKKEKVNQYKTSLQNKENNVKQEDKETPAFTT